MNLSNKQQDSQLSIPPTCMNLYPAMDTLQDVVDLAESKLPINNKNDLLGVLFCYHNTMLKVLND